MQTYTATEYATLILRLKLEYRNNGTYVNYSYTRKGEKGVHFYRLAKNIALMRDHAVNQLNA